MNRYEVVFPCVFNLHFQMICDVEYLFMHLLTVDVFFFNKITIQVFCLFFELSCLVLCCWNTVPHDDSDTVLGVGRVSPPPAEV